MAYLDNDGLLYLWTKLKALFAGKVDKVDGKGLSTNDFTSAEKSKLAGIADGANKYVHPTTTGYKHIPSGGSAGQILRWSKDGEATWGPDNNTTYSAFKGATADANGGSGLVPTPTKGNQGLYLRGDGTWATPANTTYGNATTSSAGLMTAADKSKLDGIAAGANKYVHPTTAGNKHIPAGGSSGQILRWSSDGTATWGEDKDTTYSAMKGATTDTAGAAGLVPAPEAGTSTRYLRSDGTWVTPPNTTYGAATTTAAGLMSAADKAKLNGIANNANNYTHPSYTAKSSGFYKVTVDATGHVSATASVGKSDITALGIPAQDTTYSVMTAASSSAAGASGLVPAPAAGKQGQYLRGDGTWATPTNTTYSDVTQSAHGLMTATDKKKLDGFGAASTYALKTDIVSMYKYKGSVASYDKLPTSGQTVGDVWDVGNGMNYAWNGTKWDGLGQVFTISKITNTEIDTVLAS